MGITKRLERSGGLYAGTCRSGRKCSVFAGVKAEYDSKRGSFKGTS